MDYSKLLQHCRDQHGVKVDTSKLTEKLLWAIFEYFSECHEIQLLHTDQWDVLEQLQKVRTIENGFPTGIEAADGQMICVGDEVGYVEDENLEFTVVFHSGAFRKMYHHRTYENGEHMPMLDVGTPKMKIVKKAKVAEAVPSTPPIIEPSLIQRLRTKALENIQEGQDKNDAHWGYEQGVLLSNGAVIEICDALENIAETIPDYGTGFRPPWRSIHKDFNFCAIDRTGIIFLYKKYPVTDEGLQAWRAEVGVKYRFSIGGVVENWQECIWERPSSREKEGTE